MEFDFQLLHELTINFNLLYFPFHCYLQLFNKLFVKYSPRDYYFPNKVLANSIVQRKHHHQDSSNC